MSESELSDSEARDLQEIEQNRRRSLDQEDRAPSEEGSLKRNSSVTAKLGLKAKSSFGFRKRGSRPSSSSSTTIDPDKTPPAASIPGSPNTFGRFHGPGPTPAQSAYIQRILSAPPNTHQVEDPLAKLRAANAGEGTSVNDKTVALTGLEESLKAFTSVEVLEGDNAFACRKCWKVKTGRYSNNHATVPEEDESAEGLSSSRQAPPSISVVGSDSGSEVGIPAPDEQRLGRASSVASRASAASLSHRTPSPLRRLVEEQEQSPEESLKQSYADSFLSTDSAQAADAEGEQSDGLSDTSSSDDEPPPPTNLTVGVRPKMPNRRKSSHFVMRRAFKRYLIAQPPEVLVFHFKRFKQMHKSGLTFTSFYDLKK
jgi:ubiquitin carboxyl-terminal hydrolase 16/45